MLRFSYVGNELYEFTADTFGLHVKDIDRSGVLFVSGEKNVRVDSWGFEQFIDDVIRHGFSEISGPYNISDSLSSVQPLTGNTGEIFKLKTDYRI